jgi:hypothetical protein
MVREPIGSVLHWSRGLEFGGPRKQQRRQLIELQVHRPGDQNDPSAMSLLECVGNARAGSAKRDLRSCTCRGCSAFGLRKSDRITMMQTSEAELCSYCSCCVPMHVRALPRRDFSQTIRGVLTMTRGRAMLTSGLSMN